MARVIGELPFVWKAGVAGKFDPAFAGAPEFSGLVGIARADITPPVGIYSRNWGSARHETAEGIHRPLFATAMAFRDSEANEPGLVLLTLDLSFWRSATEENEIRQAILDACSLAPSQVVLHQAHSHSAPPTAKEFAHRPGGHLIAAYSRLLIERCIQVVQQALEKLEPCVLSWARGSCRLAYDRNYAPDDEAPPMIGLNPGIVVDDTVTLGRVVALASGKTVATILNYACHPVSLGGANRLISPDYVGAARETIELATPGALCLFLQGASGDLTPRRSYESDPAVADQNGRELGFAALSALASLLPPLQRLEFAGPEHSGATLALWRAKTFDDPARSGLSRETVMVRLALAPLPSREELRDAIGAATDAFQRERLERRLLLRETVGDGPDFDFRFEVVRLGRSFLVATPAEPHSEFQLELRRRFPDNAIAVANIANGYLSYLPPPRDYERGTYQTRVALFQAGSLERVTDAAAAAIARMISIPTPRNSNDGT